MRFGTLNRVVWLTAMAVCLFVVLPTQAAKGGDGRGGSKPVCRGLFSQFIPKPGYLSILLNPPRDAIRFFLQDDLILHELYSQSVMSSD